ncbi:site-specific integrase [Bacillus sp. HMF5848]|uniref:site-specific integrase n=1 Tax=Bacillus sp. HMF5848 TaxID=2495421 RepID=UPI000F782DEC|nr:site-specific integrase [Bacillus sp. HMF5848]RSK26535.1 site-specific integrase [Bacillus sp. HMF5848]
MDGHIYQRRKTFTYVVDLPKDPVTGKRRQKTKGRFKTEKEARRAMRKFIVQLEEGEYLEPSKELFSEFILNWFNEHYSKRIKATTAESRRYTVKKHLIEGNPFANNTLDTITAHDIDSLYNTKLDAEYSTSYIRKIHQLLTKAFDQAVKWNKIKENPAKKADPPCIKREEMRIWSFEHIHRFLDESTGERTFPIFYLALYTGMRRGEILGLMWKDIDFDKKVIHVKRTLSFVPKKGYIFTSPKTARSKRQIPVSNEVIQVLQQVQQTQREWKKRLQDAYEDNDLVFCTELGKPQDPQNILRVMRRLIEGAGVTRIRFHDLRHTHASILLNNNVDIVKVSARLGHANPRVTLEIYAHLLPNNQSEVPEVFEDLMKRNLKEPR